MILEKKATVVQERRCVGSYTRGHCGIRATMLEVVGHQLLVNVCCKGKSKDLHKEHGNTISIAGREAHP